jgi:hypothetical protein
MEQQTSVFISFATRDKELVEPFIMQLRHYYKLLLYDSHEPPVDKIADELQAMQKEAAGTIVFWTKNSSGSEWLNKELRTGYSYITEKSNNKFLVAVTIGEKLPDYIQGIQTFDTDKLRLNDIIGGIRETISRHGYGPLPEMHEEVPDQLSFEILSTGSKGKAVIEIQTRLKELGFFRGAIDGIFGRETVGAVSEFQQANFLPANGYINEGTYNAILKAQPSGESNVSNEEVPNQLKQEAVNSKSDPVFILYRLRRSLFPPEYIESGYANIDWDVVIPDLEINLDIYSEVRILPIIPAETDKIPGVLRMIRKRPAKKSSNLNQVLVSRPGFVFDEEFISPVGLPEIESIAPALTEMFTEQQEGKSVSLAQSIYQAILDLGRKKVKKGKKEKKPYENLYLPFYLTEGDHKDTQDQLQFENDINSFASVISLKKVKPPLAIGLFGKWGSGKSFFMEKLGQKIERISQIAKKENDPDSIHNVVQVKFNSWHYSDANLWASLITEIFDSLNKFAKTPEHKTEIQKLSDTLQITSMQKAALESKRLELQNSILQLEADRAVAREKLEDFSGIGLVKLILSDARVKEDLNKLSNGTIEELVKDKQKLTEYQQEIKKTGNRAKAAWNFIKTMKGWRWLVVIASVLFVIAAAWLVPKLFPEWKNIIKKLTAIITGIIAVAGNFIYPAKKKLDQAFDRLENMKKTLDERPEPPSKELNENYRQIKEVTASLQEIDAQLENAKKEIEDVRSGRKLLEFIEQRTREENYSKQLGLISWIRKDFDRLDELLRKQHEATMEEKANIPNPQNVQLQIDRIILYIDDLDRCKEEIVVKVLEAIHLLLAFPLFVVVVGVDPRWLNNALSERYKLLFGSLKPSAAKNIKESEKELFISGAATSYDYLEKIFQIPFTLKPIDKPGRQNLIAYLLKNEMTTDGVKNAKEGVANPGSPGADNDTTDAQVSHDNTGNEQKETNVVTQQEHKQQSTDVSIERKMQVAVTFTDKEKVFMQDISAIFGHTPRGINRYVNIYRIIKAHKSLKVEEEFSEDEFIPLMLVLGIIVGFSVYAQDFIKHLEASANNVTLKEFLKKKEIPPEICTALSRNLAPGVLNLKTQSLKTNLDLISRFSFRTLIE